MFALQVTSIRQEAQTWDESIYLAAGYAFLTTGDRRLNVEHPPLGKAIVALPLLALGLHLPAQQTDTAGEVAYGHAFLYGNRLPADDILFAARTPSMLLTLALGALLALWTRARAGNVAGLIALTLYVFDPTILAHGRYATDDIAVTLFSFAAVLTWERALLGGANAWYAIAGVLLGMALGTKYSALFLLPVFAILAVARFARARSLARGCLLAAACATAVLLTLSLGDLGLYARGIAWTASHSAGQLSYLFGMESTAGWWWYFPAAFAVKTPVGTLLLCAGAIALAVRHRRELGDLLPLAIAIVTFAAFCTVSRADLGIRYLLPLYPFLFAFAAIVCARYAWRTFVGACLAALIVESVCVFPNYLAFFNVIAGGPGNGPKYLIDSNVDWGQDAKKLSSWLDAHGIAHPCVAYFGNADLSYYGIETGMLPGFWDVTARRRLHCVAAVSATYLYGARFIGNDAFKWLRALRPVDKIGYSIYVYDLRGGDPSLARAARSR